MSKYQMIFQDILSKIKNEEIKPNSYLPSESELMKVYSASRDTIRKALDLLLQKGYIQKTKGKGSMVLDTSRIAFPISGLTSFHELKKTMKGQIETIVVVFFEEEVNDILKKELYMDSGKVYHIERIRKINGEKVIYDIDYLKKDVIKGLSITNAQNSLYDYIENELKLQISFARKEITIVKATEQEKILLDMQEYDFLVCVKSYVYLEDATLFQYSLSKHRPDKFRFVDFARRSQL